MCQAVALRASLDSFIGLVSGLEVILDLLLPGGGHRQLELQPA